MVATASEEKERKAMRRRVLSGKLVARPTGFSIQLNGGQELSLEPVYLKSPVLDECRRVLSADGTLGLNLGASVSFAHNSNYVGNPDGIQLSLGEANLALNKLYEAQADFEAAARGAGDRQGWTVTSGTFDASSPGNGGTGNSLQSSSFTDSICDQVVSPQFIPTATTTLRSRRSTRL